MRANDSLGPISVWANDIDRVSPLHACVPVCGRQGSLAQLVRANGS